MAQKLNFADLAKEFRVHPDSPAARVLLGRDAGNGVSFYAWTSEEMGVPTVEIRGNLEGLAHMKPETAEAIANALLAAAVKARG